MITSGHARAAMEEHGISEAEVAAAVACGRKLAQKIVKDEIRYSRAIDLKGRTIIVIFTFRDDQPRVITCYPLRSKTWE